MLKSYLKIAIRNLLKHKAYSFINVFGLAIGMTAFLLILHYVLFELSYDRFHANHQNIYRVKTDYVRAGELIFDAADNFPGVGPALKRELSEVVDYFAADDAPSASVSPSSLELPQADRVRPSVRDTAAASAARRLTLMVLLGFGGRRSYRVRLG